QRLVVELWTVDDRGRFDHVDDEEEQDAEPGSPVQHPHPHPFPAAVPESASQPAVPDVPAHGGHLLPPQPPRTCMGSRTASAERSSAARSSEVNSTSMMLSSPFRPSLHGTPRKSPLIPYSPSSHAEHGRIRFLSFTMASAICTAAAEGA